MLPTFLRVWVGGRIALLLLVAVPLVAADVPLFPTPLHFVRRIEDPFAGEPVEVDEYCVGNRIITIHGPKTAIVDYGRNEVLEIDRAMSTYSVAPFDEIAQVRELAPASKTKTTGASTDAVKWNATSLGAKSAAGRSADAYEIAGDEIKIEVSVDRQLTLSRAALDAITGAAYPNKPTGQQEALARVCAQSANAGATRANGVPDAYGIPLDQSITIADDNHNVTIRNSIVRITNELPPPDLLAIPAGARLVESLAAQMLGAMKELGHTAVPPHP